ncbi:hypothetical protein ACEPAF_4879 [Sanghuangporus sanghuang]
MSRSKTSSTHTTLSIFYGSVINPKSLTHYERLPRALIIVNHDGTIMWMGHDVEPRSVSNTIEQKVAEVKASSEGKVHIELTLLNDGEFIMPGFIDTHTHAPQVPNMGIGGQLTLLDWLDQVTYPMEGNFTNPEFAKKVYPEVVRKFIAYGTTTCCYYGTSHLEATKVLADVVLRLGMSFSQRALVGKCNMNRDCPDDVKEPDVDTALDETKEIIKYIRSLNSDLVHPVVTPRFAISCTDKLLCGLGKIVKSDKKLATQTHIAENTDEYEETMSLFPKRKSYANVYDHFGLLNERTILAHGVYLNDLDLEIIKENNSGVSHCPTSNFNLTSGMAKVGEILDRGIKVGLGTDVSGGFLPSMITAIQHASICSKMVALQSKDSNDPSDETFAGKPLKISTLLYLATLGGASLCCMEDKIGSFVKGKSFDALIVSVRTETGNPAIWSPRDEFSRGGGKFVSDDYDEAVASKTLDTWLERFFFGGDDRNIRKVFVQGKCIGGKHVHPHSDAQLGDD